MNKHETLMSHFIMVAPPPAVPYDVYARGSEQDLHLSPLKPNYKEIITELEKIGDDWHLRDEHVNPRRKDNTKAILDDPLKTSAWHFKRGDLVMGFCVAVKGGFNAEMSRIAERVGLEDHVGAEIYKVGLYREFTQKGYGQNFLPLVQIALLNGQKAVESRNIESIERSDYIYLNTRLTNLVDSRHFYNELGYIKGGDETWSISPTEFAANQNKGIENATKNVRPLNPNGRFKKLIESVTPAPDFPKLNNTCK